MKRILAVAMMASLSAWAQEGKPAEKEKKDAGTEKKEATAAPAVPQMPKPSEQAAKLQKLFGSKKAWSGKMAADAMGPGTPEMPTKGTHDCRAIADKFFYACDMDVSMGSGKQKMTWKGHFVTGWDPNASAYKAYLFDNMGMLMPMDGTMTDTTYQVTSTQELPMMGQKTKARFTWDWSDPKQVKFTSEHQVTGGGWQLFETEIIKGGVK